MMTLKQKIYSCLCCSSELISSFVTVFMAVNCTRVHCVGEEMVKMFFCPELQIFTYPKDRMKVLNVL